MKTLPRAELDALIRAEGLWCVSLYSGIPHGADAALHGPLQLKNLLVQAEEDLIAHGMRSVLARDLLRPARALLDQPTLWQQWGGGLALFLDETGLKSFRCDTEFTPFFWVGRRFYVKPLLSLLEETGHFYVLAVSLNEARLYRGDAEGLAEVEAVHLPQGVAATSLRDTPDAGNQAHTGGPHVQGKGGGVFHGQGGSVDAAKVAQEEYLRAVDEAAGAALRGQQAPLIFAGVGYLFAIFRRVSRYPTVFPTAVEGNPDRLSRARLHQQAYALVRQANAGLSEFVAAFDAAGRSGRASSELPAVLLAAEEGRVAELYVASDACAWGRFEPPDRTVERHTERLPRTEDLLDRAAVEVWKHGGAVHVAPRDMLPGKHPAAAVFRYALSD